MDYVIICLDLSQIDPPLTLPRGDGQCSIGVRLVFDWCSIGVRLVFDRCSIGARSDRETIVTECRPDAEQKRTLSRARGKGNGLRGNGGG